MTSISKHEHRIFKIPCSYYCELYVLVLDLVFELLYRLRSIVAHWNGFRCCCSICNAHITLVVLKLSDEF